MRIVIFILMLLCFRAGYGQTNQVEPAGRQMLFDSLTAEEVLTALPASRNQMEADVNIIRAVEAIDKKYRQIADTLYRYKSLGHTILQAVIIGVNDSIAIDPLTFGDRIKTKNIIFNNKEINDKVDSMARRLKKTERNKLFNWLKANFDNFNFKERKLYAQPVRIKYIKFSGANLVNVGIDIYGEHFLWTIDKTQNWDVVKVEALWKY